MAVPLPISLGSPPIRAVSILLSTVPPPDCSILHSSPGAFPVAVHIICAQCYSLSVSAPLASHRCLPSGLLHYTCLSAVLRQRLLAASVCAIMRASVLSSVSVCSVLRASVVFSVSVCSIFASVLSGVSDFPLPIPGH